MRGRAHLRCTPNLTQIWDVKLVSVLQCRLRQYDMLYSGTRRSHRGPPRPHTCATQHVLCRLRVNIVAVTLPTRTRDSRGNNQGSGGETHHCRPKRPLQSRKTEMPRGGLAWRDAPPSHTPVPYTSPLHCMVACMSANVLPWWRHVTWAPHGIHGALHLQHVRARRPCRGTKVRARLP